MRVIIELYELNGVANLGVVGNSCYTAYVSKKARVKFYPTCLIFLNSFLRNIVENLHFLNAVSVI
jgi:hypothetical protein